MNEQLVNYIRTQLQSGYSVAAVRDHLITHGYPTLEVDEAIRYIYYSPAPAQSNPTSLGKIITIALIGLLIVLLIPTGYYYFTMFGSDDIAPFQARLSNVRSSVLAGSALSFSITVDHLDPDSSASVSITNEIIGTSIKSQQTIANTGKQQSMTATGSIAVPATFTPGTYTLKTSALYAGTRSFATAPFTVREPSEPGSCIPQWECTAWQPSTCPSTKQQLRTCRDVNQCDVSDGKPATSQTCAYPPVANTTPVPSPLPTPTPSPNPTPAPTPSTDDYSKLTVWEKLSVIEETAKTDKQKALSYCPGFPVDSHRDECYLRVAGSSKDYTVCTPIISDRSRDKCYTSVAEATNDATLCEQVGAETRKDSCYMVFVNNKDYTVCDKIINSYLRDACAALREMPEVTITRSAS